MEVLAFLQEGLEKGLSTSTQRHQVAAISTVRGGGGLEKENPWPNVLMSGSF